MRSAKRFRASAGVVLAGILAIFALARAEKEKPNPFVLGALKALPGQRISGFLDVPEKEGIGTRIPVTIIHGIERGKVLTLVAGVHGYEYPPILALYRMKEIIDPQSLKGTLILVHIANLPGFQKRIIYYNPFDWKNLNRVFPGDPNGTLSQRIAYILSEEVIKRSDCVIDLHCGDGNEALIPYTYWMRSANENLNETTKNLALAFGIRHIIVDDTKPQDLSDSKYLSITAILQGKPSILTESGFLGGIDEKSISRNVDGCLGVMRYYRMIEGEPEIAASPIWIDKFEVIYSNWDGLFYPLADMGQFVIQGQKVGYITDLLGDMKEEIKAPFSGVLLYIIATPPISKGEPLFEVGRVTNN